MGKITKEKKAIIYINIILFLFICVAFYEFYTIYGQLDLLQKAVIEFM